MELVNPALAKDRVKAANDKYFGTYGTFTQIQRGK